MVGGGSGIPERVLGVLPSRAQAVLEPSQGHQVDHLRRTRGTAVARSPSACRRRWRMTSASTVWTRGRWAPYCRGREAAIPSLSGTVP